MSAPPPPPPPPPPEPARVKGVGEGLAEAGSLIAVALFVVGVLAVAAYVVVSFGAK